MHAALSTLVDALNDEHSPDSELMWAERYLVAGHLLELQVHNAEPQSQHLQLTRLQMQRLSSVLGCMRFSDGQCTHGLCVPR